jgi:hypothetical protein
MCLSKLHSKTNKSHFALAGYSGIDQSYILRL